MTLFSQTFRETNVFVPLVYFGKDGRGGQKVEGITQTEDSLSLFVNKL